MVQLASIDDALARLQRGEYGFCAACGTPLARQRLDALPEASLCICCKRQVEKHEPARDDHAASAEPALTRERETKDEK